MRPFPRPPLPVRSLAILSAFPAEVQATILAAIDGTSDEEADRLLQNIERALSAAIAEKP